MRTLPLILLLVITTDATTSCPNTTATGDTKPLYLLLLVPQSRTVHQSLLAPRIAQEEINNRSDILSGYHVELIVDTTESCYSNEAGIGLSNLIKHTVNPPCRPVIAVMGLRCSSHTAVLSPVAGHTGFDLIQLSRAISPIFESQNNRFPHLWRFAGATTVYSDTVLAIMDQFDWTKIGIVYNLESSFYSELAKHIEGKIKESSNKSLAFSLGIRKTNSYYLDGVISNIKSKESGVLVSLLNVRQTKALLRHVHHHRLVYPHYIWIHVGDIPIRYINHLSKDTIYKSILGHIFLHTRLKIENEETQLISNETFFTYKAKYFKRFKELTNRNTSRVYGTSYYDQVWTLALALNRSLAELKSRNLSIDNYTIEQPEITTLIEERLKNVSFQGATGWIEFNQFRSTTSPINVFWILNNKIKKVGVYNSLHSSNFNVSINIIDVPNDTVPRVYKYILISFPVTIVLYILTGGVIIFITIQLILYFYHRKHEAIKATSPCLSFLMFAGCYMFCVAAVQLNTLGSFSFSNEIFLFLSITYFILTINGNSLVFLTLFVKLLRVHRIFEFWNKDPSNSWNNLRLFPAILSLSVIPNIGLAVLVALEPPTLSPYQYKFFKGNLPEIEIHTRIEPTSNYFFICLATLYTTFCLVLVVYMGIRNRKIKMKNFKISGQVYKLLATMIISLYTAISLVVIFLVKEQESIANAIMVILLPVFAITCQLVLYSPKILTAVLDSKFPKLLPGLRKFSRRTTSN